MSNIDLLAHRQMKISRLTKKLDEWKKQVRDQLFEIADSSYGEQNYLLPTITMSVPLVFFERTGLSNEGFLATRFPAWELLHSEDEDDHRVFVLKKLPAYAPYSVAGDEYEISRSVSEMTPEVDWETMKAEDPNLFMLLAKPVESYELDVNVFQDLSKNPEFDAQGFLARHSIHRKPTLRVLAKEVKDE